MKFALRASEIRLRRVKESLRDKLWWVPTPHGNPQCSLRSQRGTPLLGLRPRTPHTPLSPPEPPLLTMFATGNPSAPPINFLMGQHVPCRGDRWSPAENCIKQNGRSMIAPTNGASKRRPLPAQKSPVENNGGMAGVWGWTKGFPENEVRVFGGSRRGGRGAPKKMKSVRLSERMKSLRDEITCGDEIRVFTRVIMNVGCRGSPLRTGEQRGFA